MSSVLRIPAATPQQSHDYLQAKLAFYTDAWIWRKIWSGKSRISW